MPTLKSSRAALALAIILHGCATSHVPSPDGPGADSISLERREAIVTRAYQAVRESFAHWEAIPDLDLDSLAARYRRRALASASRRDFDRASSAFFGALHNGHTGFTDQWLTDRTPRIGFGALWLDGAWVVTRSEYPGLAVGDTIRAIDGEPVETLFAARRDEIPASDERAARTLFFAAGRFFPLRMRLTLANGGDVVVDRGTLAPLSAAPVAESRGRWLARDSVAYIAIPSFNDGRFESRAVELVREYATAPALVVDVRGNGGGNTPMRLIKALLDRPAHWWSEASTLRGGERAARSHGHPGQPRINGGGDVIDPDALYRGRLIVLADRRCASACEDFLMPLATSGRAVVVGETTMGTTGQPRFEELGDGMRFAVGAKRAYFPDGTQFEGVGIAPAIAAPLTAADLRARRDGMLAAAIAAAGSSH